MKHTLQILFCTAICGLFTYTSAHAQGCVAIKGDGPFTNMEHTTQDTSYKGWELTASWRYFKSFRHFKGTDEQKQRQVIGNEVINHQHTIDINLTRNFNQYWSVSVGIPYLVNTRSSLYEHGGKERHKSYSDGIGDSRIIVNR